MNQSVATKTFALAIGGMTCASCVARVEKLLSRVPGVNDVAVNLATETATLRTDPGTVLASLTAAVARAGYTATLRADARPATNQERNELIASAILTAPLFLAMCLPIPPWLQLILATIVQFWLGARFYRAGALALRAGTGNMDLLVALGTSAAYFLSLADFFRAGPLYFESAAAVITLIRLGKFLESGARHAAAAAITGLEKLRPATAHRPGAPDLPLAALRRGDIIEIRPGERVPLDGEILTGTADFDESLLTGESFAPPRAPGDKILAGALNRNGLITMRVSATLGESFLDRMSRLIDSAQASKAQIQQLVDRVAAIFVPIVVLIALATFAAWLLHGAALATAIIDAVSVLVIACPCALGLATPAAILAGTTAAARSGFLLRNADAIQAAAHIDMVVFDKTGTLTSGTPTLSHTEPLTAMSREKILHIAAALAAADTHPLSAALRRPGVAPAANFRSLPGRGIEGTVDGEKYLLGSAALIDAAGGARPENAGDDTRSYLATADGTPLAAFAFTDTIRPDAAAAIARLRRMGIDIMLLTGDHAAAAAKTASALGIEHIRADATPAEKLQTIQTARAGGRNIAMVGDGINDAAALAAADCGIAIGNAADIAIEAAAISILRPDLALVPAALQLARKTQSILRQNLFWALLYNVIGIPAAALGLLTPTIAGAAMAASSLCVLANALRLRRWRPA
jgi:Cu+-exporting ATPase